MYVLLQQRKKHVIIWCAGQFVRHILVLHLSRTSASIYSFFGFKNILGCSLN